MDIVVERIVECIGPRHGAVKELADALGVHPNVITAWKNGSLKSYRKYLPEIAVFFDVSVEWLTGQTDTKKDPAAQSDEVSEDAIKFALFGGNCTDAQYEEVKQFARFIKERDARDNK